jgi:hypothetical protein
MGTVSWLPVMVRGDPCGCSRRLVSMVWFAKTLHALHYNDFLLLGVTPSAWIAG